MTRDAAMRGKRKPLDLSLRIKQGLVVAAGAAVLLVSAYATYAADQRAALERSLSETLRDWSPSVLGPATTRLIFVSDRTGSYHIYDKYMSSGRITMLTAGQANDMNPQVSPDQKDLVFYSDRTGSNQIYTLSLQNPGKLAQLTHDIGGVNDYDPVFMPDGRHILYKKSDTNGNYGDIWEMNTDGTGQRNLTAGLIARGIEGWKPAPVSNNEVIITERAYPKDPYSDNLYMLNVQSGAITPLTNNSLTNWYPDYSQQVRKLVFVTKEAQDGNDVIATRGIENSPLKVLVRMPGDNDDPSWSPDGVYVVFLNNNDGPYDIYVANTDSGVVHLIDKSPAGSDDLSPILIP
jgi:Tol biopolymer transport system component